MLHGLLPFVGTRTNRSRSLAASASAEVDERLVGTGFQSTPLSVEYSQVPPEFEFCVIAIPVTLAAEIADIDELIDTWHRDEA
jgi:hypothetical protein